MNVLDPRIPVAYQPQLTSRGCLVPGRKGLCVQWWIGNACQGPGREGGGTCVSYFPPRTQDLQGLFQAGAPLILIIQLLCFVFLV